MEEASKMCGGIGGLEDGLVPFLVLVDCRHIQSWDRPKDKHKLKTLRKRLQ
jgi:hypothetical protein